MVSDCLSSCQLPLQPLLSRARSSRLLWRDPAVDAGSGQAKTLSLGWAAPPQKKQVDSHWNLLMGRQFHDTNMCMMSAAGRLRCRQAQHTLKERIKEREG